MEKALTMVVTIDLADPWIGHRKFQQRLHMDLVCKLLFRFVWKIECGVFWGA